MTSMTLEARYKLEMKDREPSEVEDLILDDCKAEKITCLDDKFVNLQNLTIINAGLATLEGLPLLPNLVKLDLSNNKIQGGLEIIAKNCPALLHLNLSGNKIDDLNALQPLKDTTLCELDLFSNAVSIDEDHRPKVFKILDKLQILDGCDVNGEEVDDDEGSVGAEDEEESGDDFSDEDGPGLSYLDNSQLDEDETEDYDPDVKKAKKRAAQEADDDEEEEPPAKKDTN